MEVFQMLVDFFGLEFIATNFLEFVPWFFEVLLAVFIVCYVFKCLFWITGNLVDMLR